MEVIRFIPVYTGNISLPYCNNVYFSVYPCVYREHTSGSKRRGFNCGLSLCIQGTYRRSQSVQQRCTVYPCVYREHKFFNNILAIQYGLSLCIQGTYQLIGCRKTATRFIPVYTGNIGLNTHLNEQNPVYPCVYREHNRAIFLQPQLRGLSLCIQGT